MAIPLITAILAGVGGGAVFPYVASHTLSTFGPILKGSGTAVVTFSVDTDGNLDNLSTSLAPAYNDATEWLPSHGTPGDWHVRLETASGTGPTSGLAVNTWYACTSNRDWTFTLTGSTPATDASSMTVKFSRDGGTTTHKTFTGVIDIDLEIA